MKGAEVVSRFWERIEVRDGLIHRATEYWVQAGHEEPPDWRRKHGEPVAGLP